MWVTVNTRECGQNPMLEPTSAIECGKGNGKQMKIEENQKIRIDLC